jgi:AcrR family transcriptional regulator
VSTATIADAVGVSQAVLFQRFGTKEALLKHALRPGEVPWIAALAAGPDPRPIPEQLAEVAAQILAFFEMMVPRLAVLRAAGLSPKDLCLAGQEPAPVEGRRALARWLRRAMSEGRIREANCEHLAEHMLGALQIRPFLGHLSGDGFSKAQMRSYVHSVVDVLWRALQPQQVRP